LDPAGKGRKVGNLQVIGTDILTSHGSVWGRGGGEVVVVVVEVKEEELGTWGIEKQEHHSFLTSNEHMAAPTC
jgi:hypothetical protein